MKRPFSVALAAFLLPLALAALPKVAVLDMIVQNEVDQSMVSPVTETIMGEIVASKAYIVLDRAYIDQVLKEKEFQLSGAVSDQQVVQAGQFLGADYVVAGKVLAVGGAPAAGGAYFLVAKMIDVKTGAILAQSSQQAEGKVLVLLDMSKGVGKALAAGGPALASVAPATSPAAMPERAASPATALSGLRIKAGFLIEGDGTYFGPPWRLEAARRDLQDRFGAWLDTVAAYKAEGDNFLPSVDRLVGKEGCSIIFMYNGNEQKLREAAVKYPQVVFAGNVIPWIDRPPNIKWYTSDDSGAFYITGMIAGALTKTGKLACLAASDSAQHKSVDCFALGAKATNPKAVVFLKANLHWDPNQGTMDAKALVAQGCDIFAPVLDYGSVVEYFKTTSATGKRILSFGRDMPREAYPGVLVTGMLTDWSLVLERLLIPFRDGREIPSETYLGFWDWTSRFDGPRQSIGPMYADILRAKKIKTPDLGEVSVLDFVMHRVDQMRRGEFEPFTGPIKDQKGMLRLAAGEGPDINFWNGLDWLVDNVKGNFPKLK